METLLKSYNTTTLIRQNDFFYNGYSKINFQCELDIGSNSKILNDVINVQLLSLVLQTIY